MKQITQSTKGNVLLNRDQKGNNLIYKPLGKKSIYAFICKNSYGYFFAFGSPSQIGGYIAFNKETLKDCEDAIYEQYLN